MQPRQRAPVLSGSHFWTGGYWPCHDVFVQSTNENIITTLWRMQMLYVNLKMLWESSVFFYFWTEWFSWGQQSRGADSPVTTRAIYQSDMELVTSNLKQTGPSIIPRYSSVRSDSGWIFLWLSADGECLAVTGFKEVILGWIDTNRQYLESRGVAPALIIRHPARLQPAPAHPWDRPLMPPLSLPQRSCVPHKWGIHHPDITVDRSWEYL